MDLALRLNFVCGSYKSKGLATSAATLFAVFDALILLDNLKLRSEPHRRVSILPASLHPSGFASIRPNAAS